MRLLHPVTFSKKPLWLVQTNVIALKTQTHAVNARLKRVSQLGLTNRAEALQILKSEEWKAAVLCFE